MTFQNLLKEKSYSQLEPLKTRLGALKHGTLREKRGGKGCKLALPIFPHALRWR